MQKVSRLIQKELASIFLAESRKIASNVMITVTAVKVSKDLTYAKVYLSIFGVEKKDQLVENFKHNKKDIRRELGYKLGNQLRVIPELEFIHDDSLDYIQHIDDLLNH